METEGIIQWKGFTPLMNYTLIFVFFGIKIMVISMIKIYDGKTIVLGCPRSDFLHKNLRYLTKDNSILENWV